MTDIVDWPTALLPPQECRMAMGYNTQPGRDATNGMRRGRGHAGAKMRLHLIDIAVRDREQVRLVRALAAQMEGDSTLVRMRLPNWQGIDGPFSRPWRERRLEHPVGVPFSSGVYFSSGVGFDTTWLTGSLVEDAAINARTVHIAHDGHLPAGCVISIDHAVAGRDEPQPLDYVLRRCWDEGGGVHRAELSPPLRVAAAAGTHVDFAPVFVGVCVTDTPGFDALRYGRFGTVTLEFVEDLTRLIPIESEEEE